MKCRLRWTTFANGRWKGFPKGRGNMRIAHSNAWLWLFDPLGLKNLQKYSRSSFDSDAGRNLSEGWRPENPEEAVLSACCSLITIIEDADSKIVQFPHFPVKELLTSGRLPASEVGSIRQYHILLEAAHAILAQVCLTVLLHLDMWRQ